MMAKREDASYSEAVYKTWGTKVGDAWQHLPLLILDQQYVDKAMSFSVVPQEIRDAATFKELYTSDSWLPWNDFTVIVDFIPAPMNYWRITRIDDGIRLQMVYLEEQNSLAPIISLDFMATESGYEIRRTDNSLLPDSVPRDLRSALELTLWGSGSSVATVKYAAEEAVRVTSQFLTWLHTTDYYPVEVSNVKRSALRSKKPWSRTNLSRIIFLNTFKELIEDDEKLQQEGESRGPLKAGHPRTGHYRTLRAQRYMNHPKYLQKLWFKPTWVGPKDVVSSGKRYKVVLPPDQYKEK